MLSCFRRIGSILTLSAMSLSLFGCAGSGGVTMDKSNLEAVVNYDAEYQGNPYLPLWE